MAIAERLPRAESEPKRVSILGATGSVGANTVDLIMRDPGKYAVEAITAHTNVELLAEQARRLGARFAAIGDASRYGALKQALSGSGIEAGAGPQALLDAAARPADWVMAAIVGASGLGPTLAAIKRGAIVALANKECLVCAGALVSEQVKRHGATLLPVDSEHSAIFQVFDFDDPDRVEKIILTASGGPFRNWSLADMAAVTPAQAVAHPNWTMGAKISVDSATMMNKGLEIIEARWLFPVDSDRIEVIVHPQSVIHSMVAYIDGSVLAQLGSPDMRTPIAFALGWPRRMAAPAPRLDFLRLAALTFESPDLARFPSLRLAREALRLGGALPTALNAANEEAVAAFLDRRIGFLDIARIVEDTVDRFAAEGAASRPPGTLDEVLAADGEARAMARGLIGNRIRPI